MIPANALTLLALCFVSARAAPLSEAEDAFDNSTLVARNGAISANIYTGSGCSGNTVQTVQNFGCGGTCYQFGRGASILLQQAGTGSPNPTASLFYSNTCSGNSDHAGIYKNEHSGCTNAASGVWGSAYLYYNCK